jgi:hypothetical protein
MVRPGLLAAIGMVIFLPYVVLGHGFFLDDWFALRNAELGVWWNAAGDGQWRARPGAGATYALTFGLLRDRAVLHAVLLAGVVVLTAVWVDRLARHVLPSRVAFGIALTWLVIPNHTSLETWPSALNITLALLFVLIGTERLLRAKRTVASDVASAVLLSAGVLCYEAVGPFAVAEVLLAAVRARRRGEPAMRLLALSGVALGAAAAWMLLNWNDAKSGIDAQIDPVQVVNAHFATGVLGEHPLAALLAGVVIIASVILGYQAVKGDASAPRWCVTAVVGGWVVIALGAAPFVRYFYSPVGFGDRVTVVSGLGGAAVLVGLGGWVGARQPRIAAVLGVMLLVGTLAHRGSLTRDYIVAAQDSRRVLHHVEKRWPSPPGHRIVFGPYPVMKRNIVAFIDADWPVQWLYEDRQVDAAFTLTAEAFESVPVRERVNLLELSELEPTDRLEP